MARPGYDLLKKPGDVTKLRILGVYGNSSAWKGFATGTVTGLFASHEDLCKAIDSIKKVCYEGVYFTPQVIDANRVRALQRRQRRGPEKCIAEAMHPPRFSPRAQSSISKKKGLTVAAANPSS
jgi:hypothetical protein